MYYPLLRGRQFELIAIRELASERSTQGYVTPIIEPVKKSLNGLELAYKYLSDFEQSIYIILNPGVGEIHSSDELIGFITSFDSNIFKPAFYYSDNASFIHDSIHQNSLTDCMIIGSNEVQQIEEFRGLLSNDSISKVVIETPDRNRELRRLVSTSGKEFIRWDDLFERQPRNSNFLKIDAHLFSEEHKYYREENFDGFSDYTILPAEFIEGGSTPRAVVIHMSYEHENGQIWLRHFTSTTNDSIANVQGKFGEAAIKALRFCDQHGFSNSAIEELREYVDTGHYPGLGTVKKLSIKNHIIVVSNYLNSASIL